MNNTEFQKRLKKLYDRFPRIQRSEVKTINELIFVLRHDDIDYCLNLIGEAEHFYCISSVKEDFVPVRILGLKVLSVELDEISGYDPLLVVNV